MRSFKERGILLWEERDQVRYRCEEGMLSAEDCLLLSQNREQLLYCLKGLSNLKDEPVTATLRAALSPLSYAQRRLWFLSQLKNLSETYHITAGLRLRGKLNEEALRRTLDRLMWRHEALRTTFVAIDGEPFQQIGAETQGFKLASHSLVGREDADSALAVLMDSEASAHFDLQVGPLIKGCLIKMSTDDHVLLITMHHIVSDGWSMGVLMRELSSIYRAYVAGREDPLMPLAIQYVDYAEWQRRWRSDDVLTDQAAYWRESFHGAPALLELPTDRRRPVQQDYSGGIVGIELNVVLTANLKALSRRLGATLFMTVLAAWALVLSRLSGQEDIVVGVPSANRNRSEIEGLIGFFVNTLALRMDLSGSPTLADVIQRIKIVALKALKHQDLPFERVVEIVKPTRVLAHTPVFQVMFAWQNNEVSQLELPDLSVETVGVDSFMSKFDLTLDLAEQNGRIVGGIEYATALFERETIERWSGYLHRALEEMVRAPEQPALSVSLMNDAELHRLLVEWNDTAVPYPQDKCVHELFEDQVRKTPEAIALIYESESLSYQDLNSRANKLAHHLRDLGVKPDDRVAICVERGLPMMVGVLAIMKSGGAYVPLDPAYPAERLASMLKDSEPGVILTDISAGLQITLGSVLKSSARRVLDLKTDVMQWAGKTQANPLATDIGLTSRHLVYVMYTSGSTGQAKGVMVEHASVVNVIHGHIEQCALRAADRVLQFASFAFDASVEEIFPPLSVGATVVMRPAWMIAPDEVFLRFLREVRLTVAELPTAFWQHWAQSEEREEQERYTEKDCLRLVVVGGEKAERRHFDQWRQSSRGQQCHWLNTYGPTEATVYAIALKVEAQSELRAGEVPIGRPIANTQIYILDLLMQAVPIGVAGEIYIGGAGVARGYLNRPELTAERFVIDPFSVESGARMYKTGDIGRFRADGSIEYLGRNDHQVKIRGFRIELGEIEMRLAEHPRVREAVVLAREDTPGDKRLVAYVTMIDGAGEQSTSSLALGVEELTAHLGRVLPSYMVPAAYIRLVTLPLTPHGKLDRRALPAPTNEAYPVGAYEVPVGELEIKVARIWDDVLEVKRVGRHDNFFNLGGHSLLAIRLVSRLRRDAGIETPLHYLFAYPTVASFAAAYSRVLDKNDQSNLVVIRRSSRRRPLYLVHDGFGTINYVYALAPWIDPTIPVLALAASGPLTGEVPLASIVDMARRYSRCIRENQKEGPYRIAGWSSGGVIAYEIANQFISAGASVEFVGMIDTDGNYDWYAEKRDEAAETLDYSLSCDNPESLLKLVPLDAPTAVWNELRSLALEDNIDALIAEMRRYAFIPGDPKSELLEQQLPVIQGINFAIDRYRPPTLPIPVTLFSAKGECRGDPSNGWHKLPTIQLQLKPIDGTHMSIMEPPHIGALGSELSSVLLAAETVSLKSQLSRMRRNGEATALE